MGTMRGSAAVGLAATRRAHVATRLTTNPIGASSAMRSADARVVMQPLRLWPVLGAPHQRGYARRRHVQNPFIEVRSNVPPPPSSIWVQHPIPHAFRTRPQGRMAAGGSDVEEEEDEDQEGGGFGGANMFEMVDDDDDNDEAMQRMFMEGADRRSAAVAPPPSFLHTETSFDGISTKAFPTKVAERLVAPVDPNIVEIKPDGTIYLPEIMYRRILNSAFGPGTRTRQHAHKRVMG
jgi:hypothetical protein